MYAVHLQFARLIEGRRDRLLGDLVEHYALVTRIVATDGLAQVPGNRLTFAVQIRREIDGVGFLGQTRQLGNDLFLARQDLVMRLPTILRVDPHAADQLGLGLLRLVSRLDLGRHLASLRRLTGTFLGVGGLLAASAGRQVADVPDTRLHHEVVAEILVDGLGLGGRLDDHQ